jgi:hyperosmotically inducible protein
MRKQSMMAVMVLGAALCASSCTERQRDKVETQADRAADKVESAADKAGDKMGEAATTTAVKSKLAADVRLSTITSINVDTHGNVVTLTGTVPTSADRTNAEMVAKTVDGVTTVVNNLVVQP